MSDTAAAEDVVLEDDDGEIIVEQFDDTPDEDKGRPVGSDADADDDDDSEMTDDEVGQYSDRVKGRIKKLTTRYHNARRGEDAATREAQEAARAAETLRQENLRLRAALKQGETVLVDSGKHGSEARVTQARSEYKSALEEGDPEKIVEAQVKLDEALAEKRQWEGYRPRYQEEQKQPDGQQRTQPSAPRPDHRARDWAARNSSWFGRDAERTRTAMRHHEDIINGGIDPQTDPDQYYEELDRRIARSFREPDKQASPPARKAAAPSNPTAPVTRSPGGGKTTVRLSASQVRLAKRMGITPEQYAKEVVRLSQNEE